MGSWNPAYYASTPEQVKGSQQGVCTWMRGRRPWCGRWKEPKWLHANFLKLPFVRIKLVNHGHVYVNLKTFLRWFGRNCIQHFTGYENLWIPCFISNLPMHRKKHNCWWHMSGDVKEGKPSLPSKWNEWFHGKNNPLKMYLLLETGDVPLIC